MLLNEFIIDDRVLAVLPATDYSHKAQVLLSGNKIIKVDRYQTDIIKDSCRAYIKDYNFEKKVVQRRFKFQQRTPVRLNTYLFIYMFPTCSDANEDVIWINYRYIRNFIENTNNKSHTDIHFNCGTKLTVNVSLHTIDVQHKRTHKLMSKTISALGMDIEVRRREY